MQQRDVVGVMIVNLVLIQQLPRAFLHTLALLQKFIVDLVEVHLWVEWQLQLLFALQLVLQLHFTDGDLHPADMLHSSSTNFCLSHFIFIFIFIFLFLKLSN